MRVRNTGRPTVNGRRLQLIPSKRAKKQHIAIDKCKKQEWKNRTTTSTVRIWKHKLEKVQPRFI